MESYEIIVVGGGHAGVEAGAAAARMGHKTAIISMDKNALGRMSCNPAIGGSAKGHLVHEIDALGGLMGKIADATGIQFKVLNKSKGPAIWSSRCQSDRELYTQEAVNEIGKIKNLTVIEGIANQVKVNEAGEVCGVATNNGLEFGCKALIITAGTFLNGIMYIGLNKTIGGRVDEPAAEGLTESLAELGIKSGRLKTGTPPRIYKDTINYEKCNEEKGDLNPEPFSFVTDVQSFPPLPQMSCWLTYTNENTHAALRKGFDRSALFTGLLVGTGPRYCPSIEDKIVRFADKSSHHIFIEPEGLDKDQIYLNGFPTSLPEDAQLEAIATIPGLENAKVAKFGYAVEYDFFPAYQIKHSLESRIVPGLYFAGQVNGTSGYEEAAAQGLMAGINSSLKIKGQDPFVLGRNEAYIGVLIDDLINKSPVEPYRIFTSIAEYRLLLRQDNVDRRLMHYGFKYGLIEDNIYQLFLKREKLISQGERYFEKYKLKAIEINEFLKNIGTDEISESTSVAKLCRRPEVLLTELIGYLPEDEFIISLKTVYGVLNQLAIELKYAGYIKRQLIQVEKMQRLEKKKIPENYDYKSVKSLSSEGLEKLIRIRPTTVGQATRIPGVRNADISILLISLRGK